MLFHAIEASQTKQALYTYTDKKPGNAYYLRGLSIDAPSPCPRASAGDQKWRGEWCSKR